LFFRDEKSVDFAVATDQGMVANEKTRENGLQAGYLTRPGG